MKKLRDFTIQMIVGGNIATIIMMLLTGFSDYLNPATFPMLSNAGLLFPVFLVINLGFLVFWLLVRPRLALVPFVGMVVGYVPVRQYSPLNVPHDPPLDALKVLSYNVWYFAGWEDSNHFDNPVLRYIERQNADIVCLQESSVGEVGQAAVDSILGPLYAYRDTATRSGGDCISIYSKYPILSKEHIRYESKGNLSAAFRLMVNGEEVIVVNNHLETTALSVEQKDSFRQMIKGEVKAGVAKTTSRMLLQKLAGATQKRAPEAEAVARYIHEHRRTPIIVCGDFNDGPISYARRTVGQGLTDCYVETANGPGISYHHSGFYVRIDHILCSPHFTPYGCYVDSKISASDHYPIITWLKKAEKKPE